MTSPDRASDRLFDQIDTNDDGRIDREELQDFANHAEGRISSTYDIPTSRFDAYEPKDRYNNYTTFSGTGGVPDYNPEGAIFSNNPDETNRILERSGRDIYRDPNPRIIRRTTSTSPITHEQRVSVRFLRPPTPPEPGPLIIKQVRPPQPPPPAPLIIRENPRKAETPPPIILREKPPTPPPIIPSETKIQTVEATPLPKRSVIIERFAAVPAKPRDIIIERWLPYGPARERRVIVEPAPEEMRYPAPTHTVILHDNMEPRINRKFENLGISREDPQMYLSRYSGSLLDSLTLDREARSAGVIEDITPPGGSVSNARYSSNDHYKKYDYQETKPRYFEKKSKYYDSPNGLTTKGGLHVSTARRDFDFNDRKYLSSSYRNLNDYGSSCCSSGISARFNVNCGGLSAAIRLGDGETKEIEYQRYI